MPGTQITVSKRSRSVRIVETTWSRRSATSPATISQSPADRGAIRDTKSWLPA
ncbi:hypothetical protein WDV91_16160 [Curtobacterium flaccumfaciens pv. flaccumfaciens]